MCRGGEEAVMGVEAPEIHTNKDGSVTIQYVPKQSGVHELNLTYNEQPVSGRTPIDGWMSGPEWMIDG